MQRMQSQQHQTHSQSTGGDVSLSQQQQQQQRSGGGLGGLEAFNKSSGDISSSWGLNSSLSFVPPGLGGSQGGAGTSNEHSWGSGGASQRHAPPLQGSISSVSGSVRAPVSGNGDTQLQGWGASSWGGTMAGTMAGSGMSALGGLGGNHLDALSQRGALGGAIVRLHRIAGVGKGNSLRSAMLGGQNLVGGVLSFFPKYQHKCQ